MNNSYVQRWQTQRPSHHSTWKATSREGVTQISRACKVGQLIKANGNKWWILWQFLWFFFSTESNESITGMSSYGSLKTLVDPGEVDIPRLVPADTNQPQDAIVREHLERLGEKAIGWWGFPSTWESRWYFFTLGMVRGDVWSWDFDWNLLHSTWCLYGL